MATPKDPTELALVRLAIHSGYVTGCCEWDRRVEIRLLEFPPFPNLTPERIQDFLIDYVVNHGGEIIQVEETREEYSDRAFYYKVIIPIEGHPRGLFVEMILSDDDPDLPSILLVNAHAQR